MFDFDPNAVRALGIQLDMSSGVLATAEVRGTADSLGSDLPQSQAAAMCVTVADWAGRALGIPARELAAHSAATLQAVGAVTGHDETLASSLQRVSGA